jgi:hypothetical protein
MKDQLLINKRQQNVLKLSRPDFHRVMQFGVDNLCKFSGATSISINIMTYELKCDARESAMKVIKDLFIDEHLVELSATTKEYSCVICFCDYELEEGISLEDCKHFFCSGCWDNFLNNVIESRTFPLHCFAKDCDHKISIASIQLNSKAHIFDGIVDSAFKSYINYNGDLFQFCPTPDCPQIYKVNSGDVECDICLSSICSSCKTNSHQGITCNEFALVRYDPMDAAFLKWKKDNDVRSCPKQGCGAQIQKSMGCNHMTCQNCKSHICWFCMGIYEHSIIYKHMRTDHGDIGG